MRKIINHLRPWCALFFAVAIGIGGNAFADHPTYHAPDHKYSNDPRPLHSAAQHNNVDEARRLIAAGNDVNRVDADFVHGWSPVHTAAIHGHKPMMDLLISSGANLELRDKKGRTPLFLAAEFGDPGVVKTLLDAGANHDVRGPHGQRVLHVAALNRHNAAWILSMLFPLLDDSPYNSDDHNNNVLHYAASNREHTGRIALFAIKEIKSRLGYFHQAARSKNSQGKTPYDQAAWLHEESKKYDKREICVQFLRVFNGCNPQRPAEILELLNTRR